MHAKTPKTSSSNCFPPKWCTLQGMNISHLAKRKIIFKHTLGKGYVSSQEGTTQTSPKKKYTPFSQQKKNTEFSPSFWTSFTSIHPPFGPSSYAHEVLSACLVAMPVVPEPSMVAQALGQSLKG